MSGDECAADWAASGVIPLTGRPDSPPLLPPGRAATVARQLAEGLRGVGVAVDGRMLLGERAALTGGTRRGATSVGGGCRLLPTGDGWAAVSCVRPDDPLLLGALVGRELTGDPWPAVSAWLREHAGAELAEKATMLGVAAAPVREPEAMPPNLRGEHPRPRPASGLLVVDFSALWAGPLCAHLLGLAGARVVKVETPDRPDGARRGNPAFYRVLHSGHRSVVLDPTTSGGRAALADLVAAADIVIEASRPRALAGFGLSAAASAAEGTVWVSITAAGRDSARIGFGDDVAAGAGLVATDRDGPVFCGDAIADPLTGLTAAVRALAAPAGTLVEVSMDSVVADTLAPPVDQGWIDRASDDQGRWTIRTGEGTVLVREPRARPVPDEPAPDSGADTASVFAELGLPRP